MLSIAANNEILIDGERTGYRVTQKADGTVVYSNFDNKYREHAMPHKRYSLSHPAPLSGNPGLTDFERDIRALLGISRNPI